MTGLELGARFKNWPENLPREDLVRFTREFANELRRVEQTIAEAFPDEFPLGDGENFPADQRLVEFDASEMASKAVDEIKLLRSYIAVNRREPRD